MVLLKGDPQEEGEVVRGEGSNQEEDGGEGGGGGRGEPGQGEADQEEDGRERRGGGRGKAGRPLIAYSIFSLYRNTKTIHSIMMIWLVNFIVSNYKLASGPPKDPGGVKNIFSRSKDIDS